MLGRMREPIIFILLEFERIVNRPRQEAINKTMKPKKFENTILNISIIVIIIIVRYV